MDKAWDRAASLREVLGYLNFSEGRSDPRFERTLGEIYATLGDFEPWRRLEQVLHESLTQLTGTSAAFQRVDQARAVIGIALSDTLAAYREHHRDLLFHQSDAALWQPFFLARVFEAVLAQGGPWDETARIVHAAVRQLNDYIGYRPVAVLERQKCEPYDHERVRPIPLYIRNAGVAPGPYHDIVAQALDILSRGDAGILAQAHFAFDSLDELSIDPRAYDFRHPANQRPNYMFGEWDSHHLDGQGRYRRFVLRQVTVDALLHRVRERGAAADARSVDELLFEASAVLAGTMLMASGVCGSGPDTHDSSVTLATLVPQIARYRDMFYENLLRSLESPHGERLREEAKRLHQPFGAARQYLNHYLAEQRAAQLQYTELARVFARMGFAEASQEQAQIVPAASARMACDLECRITASHLELDRGDVAAAWSIATELEPLLHRGIECGALIDPWNILGFQGQFSVFIALENSVPDPRVEQLTEMMDRLFTLYSRLLADAAASGQQTLEREVAERLKQLAAWWDQFATVEISGVRRVHGREAVESSVHVARALASWHRADEAAGDVAFWREHSEGFHSPRAYAQVVRALIDKRDHVAAMGLLMRWISQAAEVPLEQSEHSFHTLAVQWLVTLLDTPEKRKRSSGSRATESKQSAASRVSLVKKFFDYLEANAEDYWEVPSLELGLNISETESEGALEDDSEESDSVFEAAYEGVSFRDSAQDGHEGEVMESGPVGGDFVLTAAADRIEPRIKFLATLAKLWQVAAAPRSFGEETVDAESIGQWLGQARQIRLALGRLLESVHRVEIPEPIGSHDSLVEFDRRRWTKDRLIHVLVETDVEIRRAIRRLMGSQEERSEHSGTPKLAGWEEAALEFDRSLIRELNRPRKASSKKKSESRISSTLRVQLDRLHAELVKQPLLYRRLGKGGHPAELVAAKSIQQLITELVHTLPRAGLLAETFRVLQTARAMERHHAVKGEAITEFDQLFRAAFETVVESFIDATEHWPETQRSDDQLLEWLEELTEPFLKLWLEHSQSLRLSVLERISSDEQWQRVKGFVETYGNDLLTPKFLSLANIRAVLERGVAPYLAYLEENTDPLRPLRLIESLDREITRNDASQQLELVLQIFAENYEEYKDYNSTSVQSDYGEKFFILFEFLRLKAWYDRANWNLQPLAIAHSVLARRHRTQAAQLWQDAVVRKTNEIADALAVRLQALEKQHGVRLRTVSDRLHERFTQSFTLDRVRTLIEPAMTEIAEQVEPSPAFQRLREELRAFTRHTTGVGLDVPAWLRVLETEVETVQAVRTGQAEPRAAGQQLPQIAMTPEQLRQQLDEWPAIE